MCSIKGREEWLRPDGMCSLKGREEWLRPDGMCSLRGRHRGHGGDTHAGEYHAGAYPTGGLDETSGYARRLSVSSSVDLDPVLF